MDNRRSAKTYNIDVLEILAVFLAITLSISFTHVRIMSDNTTAISYINNFGDIKSKECNDIAL